MEFIHLFTKNYFCNFSIFNGCGQRRNISVAQTGGKFLKLSFCLRKCSSRLLAAISMGFQIVLSGVTNVGSINKFNFVQKRIILGNVSTSVLKVRNVLARRRLTFTLTRRTHVRALTIESRAYVHRQQHQHIIFCCELSFVFIDSRFAVYCFVTKMVEQRRIIHLREGAKKKSFPFRILSNGH